MFRVIFSRHAIGQMFDRGISIDDIETTISNGEVIEAYTDDKPYPSRLILHKLGDRPIHVVVADNLQDQEVIVVTAYEPSLAIWELEFRKRKLK